MSVRSRLALITIGAALTATALAGCTGDGSTDATPTPSATTSTAETPAVTDITDNPGSAADFTGALADTKQTTCELSGGAWNVAGTVTNPTESAQHYRIYVSLNNESQETRGLKQVDVESVAAGATADWSTTIETGEKNLSCVLRVERFAA
ncbi:hypothetical protein ACPEEZ_13830 [Frigoribacterium sp. 2-23]|uniref:hypothetical protein n=1 Tax=Frigoribacterium sp. 2-23 TaxID=3415006 RepID=UPI003C6ED88A